MAENNDFSSRLNYFLATVIVLLIIYFILIYIKKKFPPQGSPDLSLPGATNGSNVKKNINAKLDGVPVIDKEGYKNISVEKFPDYLKKYKLHLLKFDSNNLKSESDRLAIQKNLNKVNQELNEFFQKNLENCSEFEQSQNIIKKGLREMEKQITSIKDIKYSKDSDSTLKENTIRNEITKILRKFDIIEEYINKSACLKSRINFNTLDDTLILISPYEQFLGSVNYAYRDYDNERYIQDKKYRSYRIGHLGGKPSGMRSNTELFKKINPHSADRKIALSNEDYVYPYFEKRPLTTRISLPLAFGNRKLHQRLNPLEAVKRENDDYYKYKRDKAKSFGWMETYPPRKCLNPGETYGGIETSFQEHLYARADDTLPDLGVGYDLKNNDINIRYNFGPNNRDDRKMATGIDHTRQIGKCDYPVSYKSDYEYWDY